MRTTINPNAARISANKIKPKSQTSIVAPFVGSYFDPKNAS